MNEASWFANSNPLEWLSILRRRFTRRKLRLFLVACLRPADGQSADERWQPLIEASDRFEKGNLSAEEHEKVWSELGHLHEAVLAGQLVMAPESAAVVRDLFANALQPMALEPDWLSWNNGAVPAIARRIHVENSCGDLPILADALEEAGCTSEAILAHARGPGPHYRGCWLLDLILERDES
ncbi:MAG: hypothetical protein AB7K24_25020 [Gemmataceae bacterium]